MDKYKLNEIIKRCNRATEGPWAFNGLNNTYEIARRQNGKYTKRVVTGVLTNYKQASDPNNPKADGGVNEFRDAEFIAQARTDIPLLINEIYRLHSIISDLKIAQYKQDKLEEAKLIMKALWCQI